MSVILTISLKVHDFTEVRWVKKPNMRICIDVSDEHGIYMSEEQAVILTRQLVSVLANKPHSANAESPEGSANTCDWQGIIFAAKRGNKE